MLSAQGGATLLYMPYNMAASVESDPYRVLYAISSPYNIRIMVNGSQAFAFTHADSMQGRVVAVHDGSAGAYAGFYFTIELMKYGAALGPSMEFVFEVEPVADIAMSVTMQPMEIEAVRGAGGRTRVPEDWRCCFSHRHDLTVFFFFVRRARCQQSHLSICRWRATAWPRTR